MNAQSPSPRSTTGVVAFADLEWDGVWYSRHQVISRLAHHFPTLVVSRPNELREALAPSSRVTTGLTRIDGGLWSYRSPRFLPKVYRSELLERLTRRLRARRLMSACSKIGIERPIYYAWHPGFAEEIEALPPSLLCYHCYDKYSAYEGVDVQHALDCENRLLARSDLALASSSSLAGELAKRSGREVLHVPHAVEFELFHRARESTQPQDLDDIPRPRLGYVARLDERMDAALLADVARRRPQWSIVLIGQPAFSSEQGRASFAELTGLPNVFALGHKERVRVPEYIHALDVAMMCYRLDNWGRYVQPIKVYEYLACGRPIVSTGIEAAREFGGLVAVAHDPEGWVLAVEDVLRDDGPEAVERRTAFARANDWDSRVREIAALLSSLAAERS